MGKKKYNSLRFIPQSINFSDIANDTDFNISVIEDYQQELGDSQEFELLLAHMLTNLKDNKTRMILLFQIMRDLGFQFDHQSCAKIIGIEYRHYVFVLDNLRKDLAVFMKKDEVLDKLCHKET